MGGVIRRRDRKERKGKIEIYVRLMAAGVIGCDCKYLGNGYGWVDSREAIATVKHIKFHQRLDQQR